MGNERRTVILYGVGSFLFVFHCTIVSLTFSFHTFLTVQPVHYTTSGSAHFSGATLHVFKAGVVTNIFYMF